MTSSSEMSGGDAFATHKANLRDTVKWLAGVFAALAGAVIAGAPLSGINDVPWRSVQFLAALTSLLVGFACLCTALVLTLRLLRSDVLFPADLNPDVSLNGRDDATEIQVLREIVDRHRLDLFLPEFPSMRASLERVRELQALAGASRDDKETFKEFDQAIEILVANQRSVLAYAVYQRFYNRLRASTRPLFALGTCALLALLVFGMITKPSKSAPTPPILVLATPTVVGEAGREPAALPELAPVTFAMGSSSISTNGLETISKAHDALLKNPGAGILLFSHSDTVADSRRNRPIARNRAQGVRDLLVKHGGIAASRVFTAELPEEALPILTKDETDEFRNRSVRMQLFHQEAFRK